jgi:hypothetical protein
MRKFIAIIIGAGLLFTACESEEITPEEYVTIHVTSPPVDGGVDGGVETGESCLISCNLNGEEWSASSCTSSYIDEVDGKVLSITGENESFTLAFSLGGTSTIGSIGLDLDTYDYGPSHNGFVAIMVSGEIVGGATGGGISLVAITLTEFNLDTRLCSGNFEFSGVNYESAEIEYVATGGIFEDIDF